jgi:hypothetical protein
VEVIRTSADSGSPTLSFGRPIQAFLLIIPGLWNCIAEKNVLLDAGEDCGLGDGSIKSTGLFSLDLLLKREVKESFRFQEEGLSCAAAEALVDGQGQKASWTVSLVYVPYSVYVDSVLLY